MVVSKLAQPRSGAMTACDCLLERVNYSLWKQARMRASGHMAPEVVGKQC